MDHSRDSHPIFDLLVDDAVAADDHRPCLSHLLRPAFQNFAQDLNVHLAFREADDVERGLRLRAHGVDVAHGIGCRDLPEGVGVVHDRREKVHGVNHGQIWTQAKYSGIVGGFNSDNQVCVVEFRKAVQDLHELGRAELGSSAGGLHVLRQA